MISLFDVCNMCMTLGVMCMDKGVHGSIWVEFMPNPNLTQPLLVKKNGTHH